MVKETKVALLLAEFTGAGDVLRAAEMVRDAGYTRWDTHSPFPIHGMDRAMGLKDSRLGWTVLACALVGLGGAFIMILWMGKIDYPLIVGGKPPDAFPSMLPIMFEMTILMAAFGTVLGQLHLSRLPKHYHPIFASDRFRSASDDKFFLSVEVADPKFDLVKTRELLEKTKTSFIEVVEEEGP